MSDKKFITIISQMPGLRRGGIVHPARKTYPADAFSHEQMTSFKGEKLLTVLETDAEGSSETVGNSKIAYLEEQLNSKTAELIHQQNRLQEVEASCQESQAALKEALAEIETLKKAAEEKTAPEKKPGK